MAEPATDEQIDSLRDGPHALVFANLIARIDAERAARETAEAAPVARPLDEWCHEDGPVLWWFFPICEPPHVGTPDEDDWPGYHTHWTPIRCPDQPQVALKAREAAGDPPDV